MEHMFMNTNWTKNYYYKEKNWVVIIDYDLFIEQYFLLKQTRTVFTYTL
jgi:hypothetical protein